jgi:outer membrane receptor protein involved in Fe transport
MFRLLGVLVLITFLASPTYGQVAGATLSGTATDSSGAMVPGAQIVIKNVATGIITPVTADSAGFYSAPNLLPGSYELTASAPGFTTEVRVGITLEVGAQQVVNFSLRVGQVAERVQVTGEAPAVQQSSSSISAVVSSDAVVGLPLNGRDWTLLAALEPGVSAVTTQRAANSPGAPRGTRGFGQQLSISGTMPQQNNYRLDGVSIVDFAGSAPGSVIGLALGVDAIAEFSVLTSNSTAEYGRTSGGVINAVTRSGTNQIHGDAYWFLRDEALDARNFFDGNKPSFHRNQFGASAGGPIQKDKTFFFFDYEGLREGLGASNVDLVPSPAARNGILHNPDGTTCTIGVASPGCALVNSAGTVGVDPLVKPFLGMYPLPNAGLVGQGDTGLYVVATNEIARSNFETARIDRKISDKDSIFGTWFLDRSENQQPDALNNVLVGNTSHRQLIVLEETHVFSSTLVNSLRGGLNREVTSQAANLKAFNPLVTNPALAAIPGLAASVEVGVPGLNDVPPGGVGAYTGDAFAWNSIQAYDDAFLLKGAHSIKFGFAFERMQENQRLGTRQVGTINFGSLSDFLTNQPSAYLGGVPGLDNNPRGIRQSLFGGYLQDDWRFSPNLTLNLGLRYEMVTVPTEVHNELVSLPTFTSPPPGRLGSPFFNNPTLRNFEPRIGFSWDPFHNGKTAVRGAFGIFDALPLNFEFSNIESQSAPYAEAITLTNLPQGSFPSGPQRSFGVAVPPSELLTSSIEQNPHRNYIMIWNLNVERQLTPSTLLLVGYVGNRGVHMVNRAEDVNTVLPTETPQGLLWPSPAGSGTRLNPAVGQLRGLYWGGDAYFDALEVRVSKRMSHGFRVEGSYTWGKNIDTGSSATIGDNFINSVSSLFYFCKSCRRALSDYNVAHALVVNYLWDVPTPKHWGAIGSHVLGGWEVGGIFKAQTGVPFTPVIGGDPLGLNSTDPWAFADRIAAPGCSNPVNPGNPNNYIKLNCFAVPMATPAIAAECTAFSAVPGSCANLMGNAGRNSLVGPGLVNFDFSLFKNNYIRRISESFNVQLRAEFFNIFNRANFTAPIANSALFDSNGNAVGNAGAVNQTSTTSRQIQFALKVIW